MILADYTFGDALLTVLEIFLLVIWFWILITVISDLFRDHTVSGGAKALWIIFLIFLPFLGVFVYLIARGDGMRQRAIDQQVEMQKQTDAYIRQTAATASPSAELERLAKLKADGTINDAEYESLKAKVLA